MSKGNKKKIGRPTDYKPEYCAMLIDHMAKGFSFECFGGIVNVSKKTTYDWLEKHPEFVAAKEEGMTKCQNFWEDLGQKHIISQSESWHQGGSKSTSLNASVWIFNMKNRFGWRDNRQIEIEDKNKPQEIAAVSELGNKIVAALSNWNNDK